MRYLITSSVLVILAASSSSVQGQDWSGFYVGVHGGGSAATGVNESTLAGGRLPTFNAGDEIATSGMLGGVFASINMMTDTMLHGIEGDVGVGTGEGTFTFDTESITSTIDWNAHLRGRIGVAVDNALFYLAGGLAVASNSVVVDGPNLDDDEDSAMHVGWTIGGGVELALTENVVARAEYLYDDYGSADYSLFGSNWSQDINSHTVRVGLSFRP
ncbi:outer membrane beta-barrel protein [Devosia sp.]|uniref:outer membrane protein n=1 Tax=Devosia sp. TaxID=1871048 RepID=UPI001AC72614|nr:outer membrane beta-barrel protein [Devosia sp.]MBN9309216.1 porin family protein [Devosia sp.]